VPVGDQVDWTADLVAVATKAEIEFGHRGVSDFTFKLFSYQVYDIAIQDN
jgi:hypothetical protein